MRSVGDVGQVKGSFISPTRESLHPKVDIQWIERTLFILLRLYLNQETVRGVATSVTVSSQWRVMF